MKNWKRMWQDELDNITPELSEEVKNTPIPTQKEEVSNCGDAAVKTRYNKRTLIIAATAILLCLAVAGTILVIPSKSNSCLFTVEINPTVSFLTDRNGKVTKVIASNADADVLLSSSEARKNILGNSIEQAVKYYVDCAAKLGYIDLEASGSAVRVSACSDIKADRTLENISSSLENYFTNKGVFALVLTDTVNIGEFCLRSGIENVKSVSYAVKTMENSETLYANRNIRNMTDEQMKDSYENVVEKYLGVNFIEDIRSNLDIIRQSEQDIHNLYDLNKQIEEHDDNKGFLIWKDYWSVKDIPSTESFENLLGQMQQALDAYEYQYGVVISNKSELEMAENCYKVLPLQEMEKLLDSLTSGLLKIWSDKLSAVMEIAGIIDQKVAELIKLPTTIAEYTEKTVKVFESAFNKRIEEYQSVYDKVREPITESAYRDYVETIETQYGSLERYWNEIKNKF